jgi:putative ABC transport system substrate-binding protein
MKRRDLIALLGCAAAWPLATHAQQAERLRRIGVLMGTSPDDPEGAARLAAFLQALQQLGWVDGSNARIDIRWGASDLDRIRQHASELIALAPDVILAGGGTVAGPLLLATRSVPVVFAQVTDPVGAGFVRSLARPGGNATGFTNFEYGLSGKWLELVREIAPDVKRVAVLRDSAIASGIGQFAVMQSVAQPLGLELTPVNVSSPDEIAQAIDEFARASRGSMIVTAAAAATRNRNLIIARAAYHKLPAVYSGRFFVADGGLVSYGPDRIDSYRHAAGYVDRILKGEKPGDLPVQHPTRYEIAINLKTAKALGLVMPPSVLLRADEVIE